MGDIAFVVVGSPRASTGYTSIVLSALGLNCGHEDAFSWDKQKYTKEDTEEIWGDSSWLAVPYLDKMPESTIVIAVTRPGLSSINSILHGGGKGPVFRRSGPYGRFVRKHLPEIVDIKDDVEAAHFFYDSWMERINKFADYHIVPAEKPTEKLYEIVCRMIDVTYETVERSWEAVAINYNHRGGYPERAKGEYKN